jgi:hypothetical protein
VSPRRSPLDLLIPLSPSEAEPRADPRLVLVVRTAVKAVAAAAGCALILAVSAGIGGPLGLTISADCLAGLMLMMLLARTPQAGRGQLGHALGATAGRLRRRFGPDRHWAASLARAADFPAFLKISSDLSWASVSRWHYDHGARQLLIRVMRAALAERHRLDLAADPARARQLVGEDIWPFLDPAAPTSRDSHTPGPDPRTLARIVDRLEHL